MPVVRASVCLQAHNATYFIYSVFFRPHPESRVCFMANTIRLSTIVVDLEVYHEGTSQKTACRRRQGTGKELLTEIGVTRVNLGPVFSEWRQLIEKEGCKDLAFLLLRLQVTLERVRFVGFRHGFHCS